MRLSPRICLTLNHISFVLVLLQVMHGRNCSWLGCLPVGVMVCVLHNSADCQGELLDAGVQASRGVRKEEHAATTSPDTAEEATAEVAAVPAPDVVQRSGSFHALLLWCRVHAEQGPCAHVNVCSATLMGGEALR